MGILLPDEQIEEQRDKQTYIVDCRVAFISEHNLEIIKCFLGDLERMTNIDTSTKRMCVTGYQAPNYFYRL